MNRLLARWRLLVAGAALIASVVCVEALPATGTVTGSVTRLGGPVAGVRVVIESASDSSYGARTDTDADGAFAFSNVPVGEVRLKVFDAEDHLLVSGDAILESGGQVVTATLDVK